MSSDLLAAVSGAQSRNSMLRGEDLLMCGRGVAQLAYVNGLGLLAADAAGERIIGAALGLDDSLTVLDRSRRLDGAGVLLVSGRVAGSVGLTQETRVLRSLGASRIEVAVLDGWAGEISGCDLVINLTFPSRADVDRSPTTASRRQRVPTAA